MTEDKPMISSEIEITPAPAIMFSAAAKTVPGSASELSNIAQKCIALKITTHGRKAHPAALKAAG
jgi:hypothetical protein